MVGTEIKTCPNFVYDTHSKYDLHNERQTKSRLWHYDDKDGKIATPFAEVQHEYIYIVIPTMKI